MEISARNRFKGLVTEVTPGAVNAVVKVDIGRGNIVSSVVTLEAVRELGLATGVEAWVVVKATDVLIGVD